MSSVLDTFVDAVSSVSVPTMSMEMFSGSMPFNQPNGLHNFIKEIRDSKSKEEERSRVDKELGNIRKKFFSSSNLSSYQKKKYVWKMCYIYMLGYEVDFGFMEFISLLSSTKFQEKSVGYMAVALFLKPGDEMMTLVINSIRNDVVGRLGFGQTLALSAVANIGGADLAEALAADVQKLVLMPLETQNYYSPAAALQQGPNANINYEADFRARSSLSKKSILCLLRLLRANPDVISPSDWVDRFAKLLQEHDLGIITSLLSLLVTLAANPDNTDVMAPLLGPVLSIFARLALGQGCGPTYLYYKTASPWLQVKCLKFLQNFGIPVERQQSDALFEALIYILTRTEHSDSINKTNGDYSILYEAINLIISYGPDAPEKLRAPAFTFIGRFVSTNEPNVRYIGLDLMNNVLKCEGPDEVKVYKNNVLESLKDTDESVRKRALENIFSLTDEENAHDVIDELLVILTTTAESMKEEFVVKIAILTEKYYDGDLSWYVDTMVRMIILAGDFVAEAIWHRVVLIVTNHPEIHDYAANKLFICVESKAGVSDSLLGLAAYLLGEIGVNICEQANTSGELQFLALHHHFPLASPKTQSILLTTYVKFMNLYPEPQSEILEVFEKLSTSLQLELQQRSCEYIMMPTISADTREQVLNVMPPFSAEKENELLSLDVLDKKSGADKNAWSMAGATAAQLDEEEQQDTSAPTGNSMVHKFLSLID